MNPPISVSHELTILQITSFQTSSFVGRVQLTPASDKSDEIPF